ncbi:unnamed protein product [Oikopleura dioica]|uniref:Cell division cycle protein 27 homolog n=1 Tax=Oikopleura dioica TaxID=34765 RepID=E4WYZ0_OIKDI|nr:unnamed protein product [Oikopleura dioica]
MSTAVLNGVPLSYTTTIEPVHGAIRHAVEHYQYDDALIMSERLFADNPGPEEAWQIANCHFLMNNKWLCREFLESIQLKSPKLRFLYARVLADLKDTKAAIAQLSGPYLDNVGRHTRNVSAFQHEFEDSAAYALSLAGFLHKKQGLSDRSSECYKMALKHNPFLFTPYQELCNMGKGGDPDQILDCTTHKYFNLLDCISPYREPSSAFDQRLKDIPFRKQSKQALQTVTNTNVGASPATSGDAVTPIQRTVSTPTVFHPSLTSFDNFSPIIKQNSDKTTPLGQNTEDLRNHMQEIKKIKKKTQSRIERPDVQQPGRRLFSRPNVNIPRQSTMLHDEKGSKENSEMITTRRITRSSAVTGPSPRVSRLAESDHSEEVEKRSSLSHERLNRQFDEFRKQVPDDMKSKRSAIELVKYYRIMGHAYLARTDQRFVEARSMLNSLPSSQRQTGWVLNELARSYMDDQKFQLAKVQYKELLELEPYRVTGMEFYASCLYRLQDHISLEHLANRFVNKAKHRPETMCILGNLFSYNERREKATTYFSRAVEICDADFAAGQQTECRHYAFHLLGHEYVLREENDSAIKCFKSAIKHRPRFVNALTSVGDVFINAENYDLAESYLLTALRFYPKSATVWSYMGQIRHKKGELNKAIQCFNKALQFNPTQANALFMKAQMYFTLGDYQKALNELVHLDKIHPKLALVNYTMAKAYHHLGQKYLGNKHMQIANELDPKGNHKQKVHDSSDLADLNYDQSMESSISVTPTAIETSEMETDTSLQNLEDLLNDDF